MKNLSSSSAFPVVTFYLTILWFVVLSLFTLPFNDQPLHAVNLWSGSKVSYTSTSNTVQLLAIESEPFFIKTETGTTIESKKSQEGHWFVDQEIPNEGTLEATNSNVRVVLFTSPDDAGSINLSDIRLFIGRFVASIVLAFISAFGAVALIERK